jgi:intracellular septation protein A
VAKYASEQTWVYSKIALTVVTFIFAIAQVLYLVKRGEQVAPETPPPVQEPPPAV